MGGLIGVERGSRDVRAKGEMVLLSAQQCVGGCGRNEWNAAIITGSSGGRDVKVVEEEATLSLRTTTKEGRIGVVYVMAASVRLVWW
jgi:hypothetical protein